MQKEKPNDHTITMRMFLSILSQFKLIDSKTLSTREVIEILASDNPLVFDFDDAFNLDFEVCISLFFRIFFRYF